LFKSPKTVLLRPMSEFWLPSTLLPAPLTWLSDPCRKFPLAGTGFEESTGLTAKVFLT
jgi:hypothetical protein